MNDQRRSVEIVSGDLNLKCAEKNLVRTSLGLQVLRIISDKNLKQTSIAKILRMTQSSVSNLMNRKFSSFSTEQLLLFLSRLGCKVTIEVSPRQANASFCIVRHAD